MRLILQAVKIARSHKLTRLKQQRSMTVLAADPVTVGNVGAAGDGSRRNANSFHRSEPIARPCEACNTSALHEKKRVTLSRRGKNSLPRDTVLHTWCPLGRYTARLTGDLTREVFDNTARS